MSVRTILLHAAFFLAMLAVALVATGVLQQGILPRLQAAAGKNTPEPPGGNAEPTAPAEPEPAAEAPDAAGEEPSQPPDAAGTSEVAEEPETLLPTRAAAVAAAPAAPGAGSPRAYDGSLIKRLARVYEGMRPKEAASVLEKLDRPFAARILGDIRERQAARILGSMNPTAAAELSRLLGQPTEGATS